MGVPQYENIVSWQGHGVRVRAWMSRVVHTNVENVGDGLRVEHAVFGPPPDRDRVALALACDARGAMPEAWSADPLTDARWLADHLGRVAAIEVMLESTGGVVYYPDWP